MSAMASQTISISIVCLTVCSGTDQRKHQSSPSIAFDRGIHRWPANSTYRGPVTRKMFPFYDVTMISTDDTKGVALTGTGDLVDSLRIVKITISRSINFLSQKLWHFHKNTSSCVENECCCPRTVNISNVNFTSKTYQGCRCPAAERLNQVCAWGGHVRHIDP